MELDGNLRDRRALEPFSQLSICLRKDSEFLTLNVELERIDMLAGKVVQGDEVQCWNAHQRCMDVWLLHVACAQRGGQARDA